MGRNNYRKKCGPKRRKHNEKRGNPTFIKPKKDHTYSAASAYEPTSTQESMGALESESKKQSANKPTVLRPFKRFSEDDFNNIVIQKHNVV